MRWIKTMVFGTVVGMAGLALVAQEQRTEESSKTLLRVGVYDSRAVAIAFAGSKFQAERMAPKMEEQKQAKAEGNQAKIDELEAWGQAMQAELHFQGFGTAPVTNLLAHIKDQLPKIAADAGVDLIVSKWQLDYTSKDADLVDITPQIIAPFEPKAKALKWIEQLKDRAPLSREALEKMNHNH